MSKGGSEHKCKKGQQDGTPEVLKIMCLFSGAGCGGEGSCLKIKFLFGV